jgi:exopolyphosphatase/pppGpp-phosphohydrolase
MYPGHLQCCHTTAVAPDLAAAQLSAAVLLHNYIVQCSCMLVRRPATQKLRRAKFWGFLHEELGSLFKAGANITGAVML